MDSLLHGEGVVCLEVLLLGCSGKVCLEREAVVLWDIVWGMWEGRDSLTCFLGEVEL